MPILPTSGAAVSWLLDTGPLVALLSKNDSAHAACVRALEPFTGHLLTTEAVLTEALHLLGRDGRDSGPCLDFMLCGGATLVPSDMKRLSRCRELMARYSDIPMDFADATLVTLAEEFGVGRVFTLDRKDFGIYRWRRTRRFEVGP